MAGDAHGATFKTPSDDRVINRALNALIRNEEEGVPSSLLPCFLALCSRLVVPGCLIGHTAAALAINLLLAASRGQLNAFIAQPLNQSLALTVQVLQEVRVGARRQS